MPVIKVKGGWKIGSGKAIYRKKSDADRAYRAFLAKKHGRERGR